MLIIDFVAIEQEPLDSAKLIKIFKENPELAKAVSSEMLKTASFGNNPSALNYVKNYEKIQK